MSHIAYVHQPNKSLLGTSVRAVGGVVTRWLVERSPTSWLVGCRRRILSVAGILIALAIQAGLIWLTAEMIQVAHGVMELWLELANQQLDLVSLYNSVRPK